MSAVAFRVPARDGFIKPEALPQIYWTNVSINTKVSAGYWGFLQPRKRIGEKKIVHKPPAVGMMVSAVGIEPTTY
jgi:hypothetical protein